MTVSTRSSSISPKKSESTSSPKLNSKGGGNATKQEDKPTSKAGEKRSEPPTSSSTSKSPKKAKKEDPEGDVKPKEEAVGNSKVKDEKNPKGDVKDEKKEVKPRPEGYSKVHELPPKSFEGMKEERGYGTLEKGSIYFLYRPRVEFEEVHHIGEVARFHILLLPDSPGQKDTLFRNIIVGRKRMPSSERHEVIWGEVVGVGDRLSALKETLGPRTYDTKTKGERHIGPARVAGKGHYVLSCSQEVNEKKVPKGSKNMSGVYDTFLAYKLVLPHEIGEVQEELFIQEEGAFHLSVKERAATSNNPAVRDPPESRRPIFPKNLQSLFTTKFIPANPPSLLNYGGAELLFIPSKHSVTEDLGSSTKENELEKAVEKEWKEEEGDKNAVREALKDLGLGKDMEWTGEPLEGHWA